ncbi:hypothetical protein [Nostoc sp.]|uniref:hypothetical protein n=1 Tax=Nostoc sp. TaxID=1180 RepID=UPI002FFA8A4E
MLYFYLWQISDFKGLSTGLHKIVSFLNAQGRNAIVEARNAIAQGRIAIVEGRNAIAQGRIAIVEARNAIVEGRNAITEGHIAIAKFNSLRINEMLY